MPQTYEQIAVASAADAWLRRVKSALFEAAVFITLETPAEGLDSRRDRLARRVLRGETDGPFLENVSLAVGLGFLTKADLGAAVSDAELASRVSAVFNDFLEPFRGT